MFGASEVSIAGFDYSEATELEEIKRNLEFLYDTPAGTCPSDRNFGLDQSFESYPMNVAQNLFALEIIEKTELYEPRAEVSDITFTQSGDGNLMPCITIGPADIAELEEE